MKLGFLLAPGQLSWMGDRSKYRHQDPYYFILSFFSSSSSFLLPGFIFKNVLKSIFSITAAARLRKNKYKKGSLHVNY